MTQIQKNKGKEVGLFRVLNFGHLNFDIV